MGALLGLLPGILDKALERFFPDPAKRQEAILSILGQLGDLDKGQMAVNAEEAKNQSVFVSGWRPFIGWVCGSALAYQYLVVPISMWAATWAGYAVPKPPTLDANLWELMFGLLGLGALRSFEKIKGVAK